MGAPQSRGPHQHPALPRRMVQEQCCHSQLEELHCATGINLANERDNCVVPAANASLETVFVKVGPSCGRGPSQLRGHAHRREAGHPPPHP